MFENVVALDSKIHANYRLVYSQDFSFAKDTLSAPLSRTEVIKASRDFPIFFPTSGRFLPVAQMGYKKNGNLYVGQNGNWTARYKPAHLRRFPFILGEQDEAGKCILMVSKSHISPNGTGAVLFEDGNVPIGGIVDRARKFLIDFEKELSKTEEILKPLKDANILVPKVYTIRQGDMILGSVHDLQIVDMEKLAALSDVTLARWVRCGLMDLIMAHLHSLDNWNGQISS